MSSAALVSPKYRIPVFVALTLQAWIICVSSFILDYGQTRRICGITLLAFWAGVALMVIRRRFAPTRFDLSWIRIGYLALLLAAIPVITSVWRLRGVWP